MAGRITLMGATLHPSKTAHQVFAASSHSLPVLRCLSTDVDSAEIVLRNCKTGLEGLENVLSVLLLLASMSSVSWQAG